MRKPALPVALRHSDPSHLLWYLAIIMVSSLGWLFYTVLRALR